jgi:hypothetical protein
MPAIFVKRMCQSAKLYLLTGLLSLLQAVMLHAQSVFILPELDTTSVYPVELREEQVAIKMHFGQHEALNPTSLSYLQGGKLDSVHLLYTDWPRGNNFAELNRRRLKELFNQLPKSVAIPANLPVRYVKQTGASSKAEAERQYHGFICFGSLPEAKRAWHKRVKHQEHIGHRFNKAAKHILEEEEGADLSVRNVLERQALVWPSVAIVADFTGSMYPYTLQLLRWQAEGLHPLQVRGYLLFNDGNKTDEASKQIGATGGLYISHASDVYPLLQLMQKVKAAGDGGGLTENDLEALLKAQFAFADAESLVLIADNAAGVRDIELLPKLRLPVKVVLARTSVGARVLAPHPDYIKIALATGGSLHTATADYVLPAELEELLQHSVR